ncbi:chitinase-3-like protein 2 isoform X2 [Phacochoerus africanus]|uniref:chitinase-3-like protein 2 isoform X2 n=1 Tax=Phacochoerus africanus TaxID=41426 RepID=UPI001FD947FC|nr:chitinase-3-like protein 2 isoform X2 [Phacochoerus africanus]
MCVLEKLARDMGAITMDQKSLWAGLVVLLLLQEGSAYKLVCYFTSWSQDRQEPGKFTLESADPFLCSHLIYSFASISDNKVVIKDKNDAMLYQTIKSLKTKNPKLKILLSIGGYLFGSKGELDFINLLSFDFHGSWEKPLVTGHNSPLRKGQLDRGTTSYYNVEYAVGYWLNKGMPAEKVVMGIPTYGRSFTLASAETAVGAPASGPGAAGPITESSGFLAYYEICQFLQGAKIVRLQDQQVPYAVKGNQWVGYDDVESVESKVQFLKSLNLAGAVIWSIDMDDFTGKSCSQGPYPLVQAVKRSLGSLGR